MRSLLQQISDSITSFSFYQHLASFPLQRTIKLYAFFLIFAALLRSLPFLTYYLPTTLRQTSAALSQLSEQYPEDLVIAWDQTSLVSSQSPLSVPYPENWETKSDLTQSKPLLGYITTSTPSATPHPDALLTVTDQSLFVPLPENEYDEIKLTSFLTQSFSITKSTIQEFRVNWEANKSLFIATIAVITPVFSYLVLFLQRVFMVLLEACLFYFFRRILGSNWKFSTAIQYTLCFFIPAELIDFVAQLLYPQSSFSFFSLTVWIYFLAVTFYPAMRRLQSTK